MAERARQTDDLRSLKAAVAQAVAEERRPPTEEEGAKMVMPVVAYLDEAGEVATWRTVGRVREEAPAVYNRFVGERVLRDHVVDVAIEQGEALDFPTLVTGLERIADERMRWLVAVPLANLLPPDGYVPLDDRAGLGMTLQAPDWSRSDEEPADAGTIFRHLGDRISAGARWRPEESHFGPLDTRRTATLYLVEDGTQTMALNVARTRARLAMALWCLLRRPEYNELWPTLADWEPRPHLHEAIDHKLFEPGVWMTRERVQGRSITQLAEYAPAGDGGVLEVGIAITRLATDHLAARAVASAAWALHVAEREPNDLERTDELMHLGAAIDALCDLGVADGQGPARWAQLTERYGIWRELRGPYDQREIEEAKQLAHDLRNITAHGSDDVLVNLGYPATAIRTLPGGRQRAGAELALARAAAAEPLLRHAVREAAARVAGEAIEHSWDDAWFRSLFS